jgi:hypothetical protein
MQEKKESPRSIVKVSGPGACGLAFAALVTTSVVAFPTGPSSTGSAAVVVDYYRRHHRLDALSDVWSIMAVTFLLVFLAGLSAQLARHGYAVAARVLLAAATLACGFEMLASALELTNATNLYRSGDATLVGGVYAIASKCFSLSLLMVGVAVVATSMAGSRSLLGRALNLGTAALLIGAGAAAMVKPASFGGVLFAAEAILVVWCVIMAVGLRHRAPIPHHLDQQAVPANASRSASAPGNTGRHD